MNSATFVSYVREDVHIVDCLCRDLRRVGIQVWLDRSDLLPGVHWESAIIEAIRSGAFFIACFSSHYASRAQSYMNEELKVALAELQRRSSDRIWFLPVLLDQCELPERILGGAEFLRSLNYVNLSTDWSAGIAALSRVIHPSVLITPKLYELEILNEKIRTLVYQLEGDGDYFPGFIIKELQGYGAAALDGLISGLKMTYHQIGWRAADIIGALGQEGRPAVPALIAGSRELMRNEEYRADFAKNSFFSALGEIGDPAAIPVFLEAVSDTQLPVSRIKETVAECMKAFGPHAISRVAQLFSSSSASTKVRAAIVLAYLDEERSGDWILTITTMLSSDVTELRNEALSALISLVPLRAWDRPNWTESIKTQVLRAIECAMYADPAIADKATIALERISKVSCVFLTRDLI
jgi:hypothetical protein